MNRTRAMYPSSALVPWPRAAAVFGLILLALAVPHTALAEALRAPGEGLAVFRTYNFRIVLSGIAMLGAACGAIGSFLVLRRKALLGDAVSHATFPGIAGAFMLATALGMSGKNVPLLLIGAGISAAAGIGAIALIRRSTPLSEDAALAIVLSVFFGAGVALMGVIQQMDGASAAGLESFILGKAASLRAVDGKRIAVAAVVILSTCVLLFKEWRVLCFDPEFARVQGWPVSALDAILLLSAAGITIIGLQAVGLILVIALLVIPPSSARCWTDSLARMMGLSAGFGAMAGAAGAAWSALAPDWPTGPVIILSAASVFFISLLFGSARGMVPRWLRAIRFERVAAEQQVLRAFWESEEIAQGPVSIGDSALASTGHDGTRIRHASGRLLRKGLLRQQEGEWSLTESGRQAAGEIVRRHRLWEHYLIRHAAVAPDHADRDADQMEHMLDPGLVRDLERAIGPNGETKRLPSPHPLRSGEERQ